MTRADCQVLGGTRRVAGAVVWTALALKIKHKLVMRNKDSGTNLLVMLQDLNFEL